MTELFARGGPVVAAIERLAAELERGIEPAPPLERLAARPPITIVIPVYDAVDALRRCVASIRRNHGYEDEPELILVDDHSGPEAERLCHELAQGWPRTHVLRNERNLGFVGTVNRGMQAATPHHDVLLLNSDTVVSAGWLDGLGVTAHLDESIGTVCPLSNAAGVFSTPVAYQDGPLPDGFDVDTCQRALELVAPRLDERVPTTSGFCMLIKRAVLDRVGYFDSMLFLRGYGEENDFNERASAAGFVHVVDDGRFVYHERAASFGAGKKGLKAQNSRILKSLHPGHVARTKEWLRDSRLDEARRPYGALLEALRSASAEERARFVARGEMVVRFASRESRGAWTTEGRGIGVFRADAGWKVDLFGIASARVPECSAAALAFALGRRWDGTRFETEGLGPDDTDGVARAAEALRPNPDFNPIARRQQHPERTQQARTALTSPQLQHHPITIVIPVIAGGDVVRRSVEAVLRETTLKSVEVLLVGDASTDPATVASVERYATDDRVTFIRSDHDRGITHAVNRALDRAEGRDVVLLHSDTVVGPRWLEHLAQAVHGASYVASATALSDSAGAFSTPRVGQNDTHEKLPVPVAARLSARSAPTDVVEVETGHGFCMYIRRDALSEVGPFDADRFPRGGAEADWCMRARERGWRHVIALRAYAHHTGGAEAEASLSSSSALRVQREAMDRAVRRAHGSPRAWPRPRAMLVVSPRTGGAREALADLLPRVTGLYEPLLLSCDGRTMLLSNGEEELPLERHDLTCAIGQASAEYDEIVSRWMLRHGVELVHVLHTGGHSTGLTAAADRLGIPVVTREAGEADDLAAYRRAQSLARAPSDRSSGTSRPPRVAVVVRGWFPSASASVHIRIAAPIARSAGRVEYDWVDGAELARRGTSEYDGVIVCRNAGTAPVLGALADACREAGTPVVVDLDDDLLDIPPERDPHRKYLPVSAMLRRLVEDAKVVTVSTAPLVDRFSTVAREVRLAPNRLPRDIWFDAPPLEVALPDALREPGTLRIVYMGSNTHDEDLALFLPAFERLRRRVPVSLHLIGVTLDAATPRGVSRLSPPDSRYDRFGRWFRGVAPAFDVAVAPLVDTPFNRAKSSLKFMEYAACGLPVVASRTGPYVEAIRDGEDGVLCDAHPRSWLESLRALLENPDRRLRIGDAARRRALTEFVGERCVFDELDWLRR